MQPRPFAVQLSVIRSLDGLLYSWVAVLVVAAYLLSGAGPWAVPLGVLSLPVFLLAWSAFSLPLAYPGAPRWAQSVQGLRLCCLSFAALSPLGLWWFENPYNYYFLVNAVLALAAAVISLFHVLLLLLDLAAVEGHTGLEIECRLVRWLLIYLVVAPLLAVGVALSIQCVRGHLHPYLVLAGFLYQVPRLAWMAVLLPGLMTLTLLFRARRWLVARATAPTEFSTEAPAADGPEAVPPAPSAPPAPAPRPAPPPPAP